MRSLVLALLALASLLAAPASPAADAAPQSRLRVLIEQLESPERAAKIEAAKALGKFRSKASKAIDPLIRQLASEDPGVRGAVTDALVAIGKKARTRLADVVADNDLFGDPAPVPGSLAALMAFGRPGRVRMERIVAGQRIPDPWFGAIGRFPEGGAELLVASTAQEENVERAIAALRVLDARRAIDREAAGAAAPEALAPDVRAAVVATASQTVTDEDLPHFVAWLREDDGPRTETALWAFGRRGEAVPVATLEELVGPRLAVEDRSVRRTAQWVVARAGGAELDLASHLAEDPPGPPREPTDREIFETLQRGKLEGQRLFVKGRSGRDEFDDDVVLLVFLLENVAGLDFLVGEDEQLEMWEMGADWPERVTALGPRLPRSRRTPTGRQAALEPLALRAAEGVNDVHERRVTVRLLATWGCSSDGALEAYGNAAVAFDAELRDAGTAGVLGLGDERQAEFVDRLKHALEDRTTINAFAELLVKLGTPEALDAFLDAAEANPAWQVMPYVWADLWRIEAPPERVGTVAVEKVRAGEAAAAPFARRAGEEGRLALQYMGRNGSMDECMIAAINLAEMESVKSLPFLRQMQEKYDRPFLAQIIAKLEAIERGR